MYHVINELEIETVSSSLSLPLEEGKSIDLSNLIFDPDQSPLKKEQWR